MPSERTYRALLVGNGSFPEDREELIDLWGPRNDVKAIREALCHKDWGLHSDSNVTMLVAATKAEIELAMEDFFSTASSLDQLLFYYSGHGIHEVYERLFLCGRDTRVDRPIATAIAVSTLNSLAETTRAAATVIMLDCCYSGIMKGRDPALAAEGRGRWLLASSRRNQTATDAKAVAGVSSFSELVAEALVGDGSLDSDGDGFVSILDVERYVSPRLQERTGQTTSFRFDGSGELAIALAPGYPVEFDQTASVTSVKAGQDILVPSIPSATGVVEDRLTDVTVTPMSSTLAIDFSLPEDMFEERVLNELHTGSNIPLRVTLQRVLPDVSRALESNEGWETLALVLDRTACAMAVFLTYDSDEWLYRAIATLRRAYELGFDSRGFSRATPTVAGGISSPEYWLGVLQRIHALGSLSVRLEKWNAIAKLVMQRPQGHDFRHYNNWVRHALTEAARANLFRREQDGRFVDVSLLMMVSEYAKAHPVVSRDIASSDNDETLTSLCRFDALACVAAAVYDPEDRGSHFYPNFARFYSERTEPILVRLVTDRQLRDAIAPVDDRRLAVALREIDRVAQGEARTFSGWHGYHSDEVTSFVGRHAA